MNEFKIVYTMPDTRAFTFQIANSLKSLNKFVDKENVEVIINPAPKSKRVEFISKYANIKVGDEFYTKMNLPPFRYKIEMCDVDADNIIFLDCDTIVLKDITELLDGNYDVFAAEEPCRSYQGDMKPYWDEEGWKYLLKNNKRKYQNAIPYNDGFMIIKNRIHNKIKDEFIEFYKKFHSGEFKSPNTVDDMHHNEFSLSLALANYKGKVMDETHHFFGWRATPYTPKDDSYILHVGTNKEGLNGYLGNLQRHSVPRGLI